eukprot:15351262-Ditylum_brightwellii.AAC.1
MKVQDKTTSSYPSGHHYGHYKAILDHDDLCMDPGDPKIDRLWLIVIVDGDMNGSLKIIWNHYLVPVAEENQFLNPVQFGYRKELTFVCLHALGMPKSAIKTSILLNQEAKHH